MLRLLRQVGDVVNKALKYALDLVQPDVPVLEICEKVEPSSDPTTRGRRSQST